MIGWTPQKDADAHAGNTGHEAEPRFSHIMGRTVPVCKHCGEPKGGAAWDYPCRKAPPAGCHA